MKKLRIVSLVISMSLLAMMFGSCDSKDKNKKSVKVRTEETEETETSEETETEETTTEETTEATTTETTASTEPKISLGTLRYEAYMEYAKTQSETADYLLYGFITDYNYSPLQYDLLVCDPQIGELTTYYYTDDGVWTVSSTESIEEDDYRIKNLLSYDELIKLPCMFDNDDLYGKFSYENTIEDGVYYGSVIAISEDTTKAYVRIGEGIILTEEEFNSLEVGDKIQIDENGYEYATVTAINDSDDAYNRVELDCEWVWFDKGVYTANENDYILMTDSENPITINDRIIEIPISPDCEVTDMFGWLIEDGYEEDMNLFIEEQGIDSALAKSTFWYYAHTYQYRSEESNGWLPMWGLIYPAVIENGELTYMNLEWR